MTNAHVITNSPTAGRARDVRAATEVFVRFADGNSVPAKVVGFDLFDDIGVVKVDPADQPLTVLSFGDEGSLTVGDPVAVIGSPFGEAQAQSLSVGVVSALDRSIRPPAVGFETPGVIQTDAAINHGNSGGPLFDGRGRVVGVAAQIESTGGGGEGVGFAVPAHLAENSLQEIVASGSRALRLARRRDDADHREPVRGVRPRGADGPAGGAGHRGRPGGQGGAARGREDAALPVRARAAAPERRHHRRHRRHADDAPGGPDDAPRRLAARADDQARRAARGQARRASP